jgi:hypothetical protein
MAPSIDPAPSFGGGGGFLDNGGGGFGGGGFDAPTNMLGGSPPSGGGFLGNGGGLGGGGGFLDSPTMAPSIPPAPPLLDNSMGGGFGGGNNGLLGGGGFQNTNFVNQQGPANGGFLSGVGANQGPAPAGGLGFTDGAAGNAGSFYQGMADAGSSAATNLWNNSTPGMLWNAGKDALGNYQTPEWASQLGQTAQQGYQTWNTFDQKVLTPLRDAGYDPYFELRPQDGKLGFQTGIQGPYSQEQMAGIRDVFQQSGLSQHLGEGQAIQPHMLPDGTNVAVLFRGDNIADAMNPDAQLIDGARLVVGGNRIGLGGTQVPDGITAGFSSDVVNHMISQNSDQIVGQGTSVGVQGPLGGNIGSVHGTVTGVEFRDGKFVVSTKGSPGARRTAAWSASSAGSTRASTRRSRTTPRAWLARWSARPSASRSTSTSQARSTPAPSPPTPPAR